jgi:hypothetical protein
LRLFPEVRPARGAVDERAGRRIPDERGGVRPVDLVVLRELDVLGMRWSSDQGAQRRAEEHGQRPDPLPIVAHLTGFIPCLYNRKTPFFRRRPSAHEMMRTRHS